MNISTTLAFHCLKPCGYRFEVAPEIRPDGSYYAVCPVCKLDANQAAWQRNLMHTIGKQTGPKSLAGKLASASNLDGHPTPDECKLIRMNAIVDGTHAKTATVFPAKPGKYPDCDVCEHFNEDYPEQSYCKPHKACLKKTEVFLLNHIAQETQNPEVLRPLMANFQSGIMSIIQSMMLDITQKGITLESPVMWYDKDKDGGGQFIAQSYIEKGETKNILEIKANPVLKILMEYLHKNGMTLTDLALTPKIQEEQKSMGGYIQGEIKPEQMADILEKNKQQQQDFAELLVLARKNRDKDPTLIAIRDEQGGDDGG